MLIANKFGLTLSSGNYTEYQGHLRGGCGGLALQGRALHGGSGADPLQAWALQGNDGVYPGDRAFGTSHLHAGLDGRFCGDHRHGGGGGLGGGLGPIPTSWETGGCISRSKADLPGLPSTASPLQFGDWIHLHGPVMRDLSSLASCWWDLTVRQAQVHYPHWRRHSNEYNWTQGFQRSSVTGAMAVQNREEFTSLMTLHRRAPPCVALIALW